MMWSKYLVNNTPWRINLATDEFFVPSLVGAAIGSMAWNDTVHLLSHPKAPISTGHLRRCQSR